MKLRAKNETEAREMLRKRGISSFMRIAGYIPPNMGDNTGEQITFSEEARWRIGNPYTFRRIGNPEFNRRKFLFYRIVLKCDEPLCDRCASNLAQMCGMTVRFHPHFDNEICAACGGLCSDDITF